MYTQKDVHAIKGLDYKSDLPFLLVEASKNIAPLYTMRKESFARIN